MTTNQVSIEDMMRCRERRAQQQFNYTERFHSTVLSFCMNIPGPVKTNPDIRFAFDVGQQTILQTLSLHSIPILDQVAFHDKTGDEMLLCIRCNASQIKDLMREIEEDHPLGRLYDIDVIDATGTKLSRPTYRKCLLCDHQAQECARSRRHSLIEMFDRITEMIRSYKESLSISC